MQTLTQTLLTIKAENFVLTLTPNRIFQQARNYIASFYIKLASLFKFVMHTELSPRCQMTIQLI